jgi:peptidoglycan biosynthesis protein MviN/MurJ (putative lipid II flippase)
MLQETWLCLFFTDAGNKFSSLFQPRHPHAFYPSFCLFAWNIWSLTWQILTKLVSGQHKEPEQFLVLNYYLIKFAVSHIKFEVLTQRNVHVECHLWVTRLLSGRWLPAFWRNLFMHLLLWRWRKQVFRNFCKSYALFTIGVRCSQLVTSVMLRTVFGAYK